MTDSDFKPSDVNLEAEYPPLIGTYGDPGCDLIAAAIVFTAAKTGDTWEPVTAALVHLTILNAEKEGNELWLAIKANPLFKADANLLVAGGFARWVRIGVESALEFTPVGLERLRRHVIQKDA